MPVLDCRIPKEAWAREIAVHNGVASRADVGGHEKGEDAGPWQPAVQEILSYQDLGDNWDGFGAKAPARELLESAVGLAYTSYQKGVHPPVRVAPGVDGSVILEWQEPDGTYADVEIVRPFFAEVMVIAPGQPARHWTLPTE